VNKETNIIVNSDLSVNEYMQSLGVRARTASQLIATADGQTKNKALNAIANALQESQSELVAANKIDMEAGIASGLSEALLDRLELTPARIEGMANGLRQVALLPEPIGEISDMKYQPSESIQTRLWLHVLSAGLNLQACRQTRCNL